MRYQFIIFDMDGTLTEEVLDYEAIRAELGMKARGPILEHIAKLSEDAQLQAQTILDTHEFGAAKKCGVHAGTHDLLTALKAHQIKMALLTRNSPRCAQMILQRHGLWNFFAHISTRDDKPFKPHPDAILNILRKYQIDPQQTLMIGDYLYDLQAANAAKVDSALLVLEEDQPPFADQATYIVKSLAEILNLVAANPAPQNTLTKKAHT